MNELRNVYFACAKTTTDLLDRAGTLDLDVYVQHRKDLIASKGFAQDEGDEVVPGL